MPEGEVPRAPEYPSRPRERSDDVLDDIIAWMGVQDERLQRHDSILDKIEKFLTGGGGTTSAAPTNAPPASDPPRPTEIKPNPQMAQDGARKERSWPGLGW